MHNFVKKTKNKYDTHQRSLEPSNKGRRSKKMEEETGGVDLGSSQSFAGTPSPPSWTKLTVDIRTGTNASDASGTTHAGGAPVVSLSEEERRRKRPLRRRAEESPYVLSNFGGSSAKTNTWPTEVVISSVIGYALVRLEAHKDKITAAMLDKPLSATDLLELSELKEILDGKSHVVPVFRLFRFVLRVAERHVCLGIPFVQLN